MPSSPDLIRAEHRNTFLFSGTRPWEPHNNFVRHGSESGVGTRSCPLLLQFPRLPWLSSLLHFPHSSWGSLPSPFTSPLSSSTGPFFSFWPSSVSSYSFFLHLLLPLPLSFESSLIFPSGSLSSFSSLVYLLCFPCSSSCPPHPLISPIFHS